MRFLPLTLLFGVATWATTAASQAAVDADTEDDADNTPDYTTFDGKKVPPMLELTPDNWEKEKSAAKYLFVKHFSPYCAHCIKFAPTFQTLYEFYYTSHPSGSGNENADFTEFYGLRFATLNCIAYSDLCSSHQVSMYPTTIVFEDGAQVDFLQGVKSMEVLSGAVEKALEKAKPGTRPSNLALPSPGDSSSSGKSTSAGSDAAGGDAQYAGKKADVLATPSPTPSAPSRVGSKEVATPTATPNPEGTSVSLSAESFQTLVTMTQDLWFIKFYAPWCPHCRAMAASWTEMARMMKGKLNIGEVNCDVETRLCKDARLHGYPTLMFFRGSERVEYDGLRGLGDFKMQAEKAVEIAKGVQEVDADSLSALEEREEVIFVYFYDHATTIEDFAALERLPLSLIGHAKLVKTKDAKLAERFKISTWPRLIVTREGRPTYYTPLTPRDMRDKEKVLGWMKSVWLPVIPELTAANAREIMDGKLVVLGILNRNEPEGLKSALREMKSAASEWMDKQIQLFQLERQELRDAKQLRIEEAEDRGDQRALRSAKSIRINMDKSDRKEVAFAWVDGIFWQRWIRTTYGIKIKDGERVVINDEDGRQYWDTTITGNYIVPSRTSILETLNKVTAQPPKIRPKYTISKLERLFFDARIVFIEHPLLSLGLALGLTAGCVSLYRARSRRSRSSFFLDDTAAPSKEFKAPMLGGVEAGGKTD